MADRRFFRVAKVGLQTASHLGMQNQKAGRADRGSVSDHRIAGYKDAEWLSAECWSD